MDPISKFSHDSSLYIYQTPNVRIVEHRVPPQKSFDIEAPDKSEKAKKDLEKRKQKEKGKK